MPSPKRKLGDIGEIEAERFLVKSGYKILGRNYRVKNLGEIDLITERNGKLYFFEVKTRNIKHEENFPIGFSIDEKKRRNLKRVCQLYLLDNRYSPDKRWQVDAIFVKFDDLGRYTVERLENILWEEYY